MLAFDLDGTLVDSAPDLHYCLGRALETLGLDPPTEAETRSWVGDGVEELVRRALRHGAPGDPAAAAGGGRSAPTAAVEPEHLLGQALERFTACYERNLFTRSRLYPDAIETLDTLRARGLRLACVTNKRERLAESLLERAGLLGRFELVLGGDTLPEKKPSPMPLHAAAERLGVPASSAAFVGDSDHDMTAARDAGWRFIWASYGYRRDIRADGADITIGRLAELPDAI